MRDQVISEERGVSNKETTLRRKVKKRTGEEDNWTEVEKSRMGKDKCSFCVQGE